MPFSRVTLAAALTVAAASLSLMVGRSIVYAAQDTAPAQPQAAAPHAHHGPPTNLKVLPHNLTDEQVRDIMEEWAGELGTRCSTCHAINPKDIGPNGKPRLNYADDSKPEKGTARKMVKMVEEINANYIAKIDSSGAPVTCGTCHRGHLGPEPYIAEKPPAPSN